MCLKQIILFSLLSDLNIDLYLGHGYQQISQKIQTEAIP